MAKTWGPRQSKPSTLTTAGERADGREAESEGDETVVLGFSTLKWASCTKGFGALHGGDPKKNGGDDDTFGHPSALKPSCKNMITIRS